MLKLIQTKLPALHHPTYAEAREEPARSQQSTFPEATHQHLKAGAPPARVLQRQTDWAALQRTLGNRAVGRLVRGESVLRREDETETSTEAPTAPEEENEPLTEKIV